MSMIIARIVASLLRVIGDGHYHARLSKAFHKCERQSLWSTENITNSNNKHNNDRNNNGNGIIVITAKKTADSSGEGGREGGGEGGRRRGIYCCMY